MHHFGSLKVYIRMSVESMRYPNEKWISICHIAAKRRKDRESNNAAGFEFAENKLLLFFERGIPMVKAIGTLALVLASFGLVGSAFAQDPVTQRPGISRPATKIAAPPAPLNQAAARPLVTLEGREAWGTTGELEFQMFAGNRAVMIDETRNPVEGTYRVVGNRLTLTFNNCVYDATEANGVMTGRARYTNGPNAGQAWNFRVTVRNMLVGRTFAGNETLLNYGPVSFRFVNANTVEMTDTDGVTRGTYTQNGLTVTMTFGNVTYAGDIRGDAISGTATNSRSTWTFQVSAR